MLYLKTPLSFKKMQGSFNQFPHFQQYVNTIIKDNVLIFLVLCKHFVSKLQEATKHD